MNLLETNAPKSSHRSVLQDLVYKYSFSAGGRRPRVLYQGRDFQYYFRLPSGDPSEAHQGKDILLGRLHPPDSDV